MIQKYPYKDLTWINVESPTSEEVARLIKDYNLHPLVGEDMLSEFSRPRIERYPDYIYLVLRIPIRSKSPIGRRTRAAYFIDEKEIDFVIGKNFILTAQFGIIEPLHNFSKIFETDSILNVKKNHIPGNEHFRVDGSHAGFIFYYMMKKIYSHMQNDLGNMQGAILEAETGIFSGNERRMVEELSNLSRELIDLKQAGHSHKEVIEMFAPAATAFFGLDFRRCMEDILKEYGKISELTANNRELVNELRDTNDSLLSTKQNEAMKVFTILAFFTFPLTLIASIFSMDTRATPIIGQPYDFEIILGIMFIVALSLFSWFKHKKWI
jgi:magnesium transporter